MMSFKEFAKELTNDKIEGQIIKTIFISLLVSFILLGILYFLKFKDISNFNSKYGYFLFFSALSYSIILPAIKQVRAYKEFPCMTGMMIGMTIGMISGFLPAFYVGATNGMFYGSVFGMLIGITFGFLNGRCCGIMGAMEGIMAGFMGALMGAMTSVMMLNDNLKIASAIMFAVSAVIMFGLNYLIYKETKELKITEIESNLYTMLWSFVLIAATTWLVVYGPRNPIFQ